MTNTTPHRATAEQWAQTEGKSPNSYSGLMWSLARCILELRARIEALECGATCPHVVTGDEGTSYCGLAEQQAATPPEPAPAGSLVKAVHSCIVGEPECGHMQARAAIRAVAEWLDTKGQHGCSLWLREEVEQ